jgi:hypothetical protein
MSGEGGSPFGTRFRIALVGPFHRAAHGPPPPVGEELEAGPPTPWEDLHCFPIPRFPATAPLVDFDLILVGGGLASGLAAL